MEGDSSNNGGLGEACRELSRVLHPDLRLLMHGSGDVPPNQVDEEAVVELSNLTVQYMVKLVEAAVDAHDILTDGAGGKLPPPPPLKNSSKKRKRNQTANSLFSGSAWDDYDDKDALVVVDEKDIMNTYPNTNASGKGEDWIGATGIDFLQHSRVRTAVACTPGTIHTQCFIFPICHDSALYGRVMEIQAARRNLAPLLIDPVLLHSLQEETPSILADTIYRHLQTTPTEKNTNNNSNNNDSNNDHRARAQAAAARHPLDAKFPDVDQILPTHRIQHIS